ALIVLSFRCTGLFFLTLVFFNNGMFNVVTGSVLFITALLIVVVHHLLQNADEANNARDAFKLAIVTTLLSFANIVLGIYIT
ncbi:hypothetical protein BVY01_00595, partial [bacterium I07]